MTIWVPNLTAREGPVYRALATAIVEAIEKGELPVGGKLPPQRELAWKLGVTVGTISRGYLEAERQGYLSGEVGRGTFARRPPRPGLRARDPGAPLDLSHNELATAEARKALGAALRALADRADVADLVGYAPAGGHRAHREAVSQWVRRIGLVAPPEHIVLTVGAQQALGVALALFGRGDKPILFEDYTYSCLLDMARLADRQAFPVAMDAEGLLPEALDSAVESTGARLLMIQPTLQNPTNSTMSLARRKAVVAVARARDLVIVEDDVYGALPEDCPPPIATLAPERTVYIGSASKCFLPGLRVGWIVAPGPEVARLAGAVHSRSLGPAPLMVEIMARWIADGTADRLLAAQRGELRARQAIAVEVLQGLDIAADPQSMHVLLRLPRPWGANSFAAAAEARGVIVVPVNRFAVDPGSAPAGVRISLGGAPDREILRQTLQALADMVRQPPIFQRAIV